MPLFPNFYMGFYHNKNLQLYQLNIIWYIGHSLQVMQLSCFAPWYIMSSSDAIYQHLSGFAIRLTSVPNGSSSRKTTTSQM